MSNVESLGYSNMARDVASVNSEEAQIAELERELGLVDEAGNNTVKNDEEGNPLTSDKDLADLERYIGMNDEVAKEGKKVKADPNAFKEFTERRKNNSLVQAVGGLAEAAQNTYNLGVEVADAIENKIGTGNLVTKESRATFADEYFPKSDQFFANAVRSTSQFLTLFIPGGQAAGVGRVAAGVSGAAKFMNVTKGAAVGFGADMLAFKGNEGRISDALKDTPYGNLAIKYLLTDKDDSELEGRLKNAIEGLGLGASADVAFKGIKYLKNARKTTRALESTRGIESGAAKETAEATVEGGVLKEVDAIPGSKVTDESAKFANDVTGEVPRGTLAEPSLRDINPEFYQKLEVKPEDISGAVVADAKVETGGGYQINLSKIDADTDILGAIKKVAEADKDNLVKRTRGVIPNDQLAQLAKDTGVSVDDLLNKKVGEAFNAEELEVARQFHVSAATDLKSRATLAASGDPKALADFNESLQAFKAINAVITGGKAEAGRALQSLTKKVSGEGVDPSVLKEYLQLSGEQDIKQMAHAISQSDTATIAKMVNKSKHRRGVEATLEVFRNNLLAQPQTHLTNFISNAGVYAQNILERGAAGLGKASGAIDPTLVKEAYEIRSKLLKVDHGSMTYQQIAKHESELARVNGILKSSQNSSVEPGEAVQMALGTFNGFRDAITALKKSGNADGKTFVELMKDASATGKSKFDDSAYKPAITSENLGGGKAVDMLGGIQRLPGQALAWADDFWKFANYRAEVQAQAHRMSKKMNLSGADKDKFMSDFINNPPDFVAEKAQGFAKTNTFTNDLGEIGTKLEETLQLLDKKMDGPYARFILPFVKTPMNIVSYGIERTPLAMVTDNYKAAMKAGGVEAQIASTKLKLGSTFMATAGIMAMQGQITGGGPKDPRARAQLEQMGWKPYSLKISGKNGDEYLPLGKFEPVGTMVGLAADLAEIAGEITGDDEIDMGDIAVQAGLSLAHLMTPEMMVDSLGTVFDILSGEEDAGKKMKKIATNITSKSVPLIGFTSVARNIVDPVARQTAMIEEEGIMATLQEATNQIKNQLPGYSSSLPARKNIFGEDMPVAPGFGSTISPFASTKVAKDDVVTREFMRLGYSPTFAKDDLPEGEKHLSIQYPPKEIKLSNGMVKLNSQQHAKYVELSAGVGLKNSPYEGKTMKEALAEMIKSNYSILGSQATDQNKRIVIKQTMNAYKQSAKFQMLEEFPELEERLNKSRESFANARMSDPDAQEEEVQ